MSGQVRPRQGTETCNFGAPSPLEALHWIFCFFSSIYVQFSKTSPLKSGESSEKSSGENRVKSCHVCGCHGFFGPESADLIGARAVCKFGGSYFDASTLWLQPCLSLALIDPSTGLSFRPKSAPTPLSLGGCGGDL